MAIFHSFFVNVHQRVDGERAISRTSNTSTEDHPTPVVQPLKQGPRLCDVDAEHGARPGSGGAEAEDACAG